MICRQLTIGSSSARHGVFSIRTFGISEKIEFKRSFDQRRPLIARDDSLSLSLGRERSVGKVGEGGESSGTIIQRS